MRLALDLALALAMAPFVMAVERGRMTGATWVGSAANVMLKKLERTGARIYFVAGLLNINPVCVFVCPKPPLETGNTLTHKLVLSWAPIVARDAGAIPGQ
jgi:hypothetical protein